MKIYNYNSKLEFLKILNFIRLYTCRKGNLTRYRLLELELHTSLFILQNSVEQVQSHLRTTFAQQQKEPQSSQQPFLGPSMTPSRSSGPVRRTVITRVFEAVRALALCHNVTPVYEESDNSEAGYETEADQQSQQEVVYQASSPDEVSVTNLYLHAMITN